MCLQRFPRPPSPISMSFRPLKPHGYRIRAFPTTLLTAPSSHIRGSFANSSLTPHPQIPSLANFGPHCLGIVGHIPVWISLLVFVLHYALLWLDRWRPIWLRNFTAKDDEARLQNYDQEASANHDESFEDTPLLSRQRPIVHSRKKIWTRWTLCLLVLNLTGAIISILGAAMAHQSPTEIQLHLIPLIPNVRRDTLMTDRDSHSTPY